MIEMTDGPRRECGRCRDWFVIRHERQKYCHLRCYASTPTLQRRPKSSAQQRAEQRWRATLTAA